MLTLAKITDEIRRRQLILLNAAEFRTKTEGKRWAAHAAEQLATLPGEERGEIMATLAKIGELEEIQAKREALTAAPEVYRWLLDSYGDYRRQVAEEKISN